LELCQGYSLYLDATTLPQKPMLRNPTPPLNPGGVTTPKRVYPRGIDPSKGASPDGANLHEPEGAEGITPSSLRNPGEGTSTTSGGHLPRQEQVRRSPISDEAPCTATAPTALHDHQTQSRHERPSTPELSQLGYGDAAGDSQIGHGSTDMPIEGSARIQDLEYRTADAVPRVEGSAEGPVHGPRLSRGGAQCPLEREVGDGQGVPLEGGDDAQGSGGQQSVSGLSLLGPIYLAAHGAGRRVVGATKRGGLTPAEAWAECGRAVGCATADRTPRVTNAAGGDSERSNRVTYTASTDSPRGTQTSGEWAGVPKDGRVRLKERLTEGGPARSSGSGSGGEQSAAIDALLPGAAALWAPAGGPGWAVSDVRTGVRALPPRTANGSLPLAGRIDARRCGLGFGCDTWGRVEKLIVWRPWPCWFCAALGQGCLD
jgi:hypothetical protein